MKPSNNQIVDTRTKSLPICLIGYQLTEADIKKLQSYLESIELDRYPLIPGNKYIFLWSYTVVSLCTSCYIYIDI